MDARWFSRPLTPADCPWLFKDGNSSWASTSAELLAAIVALVLFIPEPLDQRLGKRHLLVIKGGVDNKATSYLVKKGISTRTPLLMVLMEYLRQADLKSLRCDLDWRPREVNVEADQLTNSDFSSFDLRNRVEVNWSELRLPILEGCAPLLKSLVNLSSKHSDPKERPPKFRKTVWE